MTADKQIVAIYPGFFDPVTLGHQDIALRTLKFADRLIVAVAETATHAKTALFTHQERLELLEEVFADEPRIECQSFSGLLVDFARGVDAHFIIRGLRAVTDFEYEVQLAQMNRELWDEIETVFLTPDLKYSFLSASLAKEVASLGGDVSKFVSEPVLKRLEGRIERGD
jgi:pantetheine-phosphate adenylyltransferase